MFRKNFCISNRLIIRNERSQEISGHIYISFREKYLKIEQTNFLSPAFGPDSVNRILFQKYNCYMEYILTLWKSKSSVSDTDHNS